MSFVMQPIVLLLLKTIGIVLVYGFLSRFALDNFDIKPLVFAFYLAINQCRNCSP